MTCMSQGLVYSGDSHERKAFLHLFQTQVAHKRNESPVAASSASDLQPTLHVPHLGCLRYVNITLGCLKITLHT